MALAWKAGWVQALTSSNLVSSAAENCALTRAYTTARVPSGASDPRFVRYLCAIFRGGPLRGGLWRTSRAGPGRRVRSARLAAPEGSQGRSWVQFSWSFEPNFQVEAPPTWKLRVHTQLRPNVEVKALRQGRGLQSSSQRSCNPRPGPWATLAGRERESTVQLSRKYGCPVAKVRMSS